MSRYNSRVISSDDPDALNKLQDKLTKLEDRQGFMKKVNAYYRKNGTCVGCEGVSAEQAAKLDKSMENAYSWVTAPFPSYELTGNTAEIRRIKGRIKELEQSQEVGYSGWEFNGGTVEVNKEINRLQIFFDEKPDLEQRQILKQRGFHFAPSQNDAWQRQLNDNALYAASRIDFIQPMDGKSVRSIQPKAVKREEPQR